MATMLMQQIPKTNCTAHDVGEPCACAFTIERNRTIAQATHAAPNASKKYWNRVTTLMTVASGVLPSRPLALGAVVAVY